MAGTLYAAKPRFQRALGPVVSTLSRRGVSADRVTWFGFAVSVACGLTAAAGAFSPVALIAVPPLLLLRMAANAVDGQLARRDGTASARGAAINEVTDVAGDAAAYLPMAAVVGGAAPLLVFVVASAMVSEVAAIAGGGSRRNHGPLGKSDRAAGFSLVALMVAAGMTAGVLTAALAAMCLLGVVTTVNRTLAVEAR